MPKFCCMGDKTGLCQTLMMGLKLKLLAGLAGLEAQRAADGNVILASCCRAIVAGIVHPYLLS